MPVFTVTKIIDGDTFEVSPQWKWSGQTGTRVRPAGYDAPELPSGKGNKAKAELTVLIEDEQVELREAYKVDHGRLVCDVFFQGKNLTDYFPEFE